MIVSLMPFLFIFGVHVLKGLPILGFLKVNCACCKLQSISASIEGSIPENAAGWQDRLRFLEVALVLMRLDHVASSIVNADDCRLRAGAKLRATDSGSSVDKVPAVP